MSAMCLNLNLFFLLNLLQALQLIAADVEGQVREADNFPEPVSFGQIPDSLFEVEPEHDYPFEYLLKNVNIRFEESGGRILALLENHYRLKVYSDNPQLQAEAALVSIPFYYDQDLEEIVDLEAVTHHPDGSQSVLDETEARTAELNSSYKVLEFIMPEVQKGSIIEYRYVTRRRYIDELPEFNFSQRVPVRLAHLTIYNKEYLRYDVAATNIDFYVNYHEQRIDTSSIPLVFSYERPEPVSVEHWYATDVQPIDDAAYISSLNDLRGQLLFQVGEFGRPRQPLENSWEYVIAQLWRSENNPFGHLDEMDQWVELGSQLAENTSSKEGARDAVFQYLNQEMTFNGMRRSFHETPVDAVLEGEPADQASINLVLLAMFTGAGVDAWPVYLSGREFGRINKEFPSIYQFNQMLIAAEDGRDVILMDASFSNSRPGMIAVESYNEVALMLKRDGFDWIEVQPRYSYFDLNVDLKADLSSDGDLTGSINVVTGGYPAHEIREKLSSQTSAVQVIREAFFDAYTDIRFIHAEIREQRPGDYPLVLTAEFQIPGYAVSFREGLQFNPMVVGYLQNHPFDEEERSYPVTLDAPEMVNIRYEITLPEGYHLEHSQQEQSTAMRGAKFQEQYESSGRLLRYSFNVDIARREFLAEEFRELRRIYDRWVFLSNNEWFIDRRSNP